MCSGPPLEPEPEAVAAAAGVDFLAGAADDDDDDDDEPQAVARQASGMRHPNRRRFNESPFVESGQALTSR
jgi:hypothetical protein